MQIRRFEASPFLEIKSRMTNFINVMQALKLHMVWGWR